MKKWLTGLMCLTMLVTVGCGGPSGTSTASPQTQEVKLFEEKTLDLTAGPVQIKVVNPEGKGPFPVIVMFHGFPETVNDHYIEAMKYLAKQNFIVVAPYFPTYGSRSSGAYKASEIIDQVAKWPRVKADQIGVWGFSMGAGTALLSADKNAKVRAVVACGAPYSDLDPSIIVPLDVPVLILHGARDTICSIEDAKRYEQKRRERNKPVQANYTDGDHSWFMDPEIARSADFFRNTLK